MLNKKLKNLQREAVYIAMGNNGDVAFVQLRRGFKSFYEVTHVRPSIVMYDNYIDGWEVIPSLGGDTKYDETPLGLAQAKVYARFLVSRDD